MTIHQFERLFAYAGLLFFTAAFFRILADGRGGSSLATGAAAAFFYLGAALVLARNFAAFVYLLRANLPLVVLLALVLISLGWSLDPALTLRYAVATVGSTLIAYVVVIKLSVDEFHEGVIWALGTVALLSTVSIVIAPSFGIHQADDPLTGHHAGDWRGLYAHKNSLGRLMAPMTALLLVCAPPRLSVAVRAVLLITGFALVLGSGSAQALVILTLMVLAYPLIRYLQRQNALVAGVYLCAGVSLGAISVLVYEPVAGTILGWMGRDLTFTGRTRAWAAAITATLEHQPLLGLGFAAGWDDVVRPLLTGGGPGHAHSGYVDLFQELGLVGVGMFLVVAMQVIVRYLRLRFWMSSRTFAFIGLLLVYWFVINIVASEILERNELPWILFVAVTLYISHGAWGQACTSWSPAAVAAVRSGRHGPPRTHMEQTHDRIS